jgi:hypothetical protein
MLLVLYRSITLRDEHRLRVFENRVLRRIFGPKREELIGDCKKNCIIRNLMICTPQYYGEKLEDNRMG